MINYISSSKIEAILESKKMDKRASFGNFNDVLNEDDLKTISAMLHKMVMLPKYDKVKNKLRSVNGIVNFVTYDEFEPLVEMLFRMSIPPSSNDIYHMGQGFTLPEDYFIDAKGFFGSQNVDPTISQMALKRMEEVFRGSPKKMTRQWLKDQGLDPDGDSFAKTFSAETEVPSANPEDPPTKTTVAALIRKALKGYEEAMGALTGSELKAEIDDLFRKLDSDRVARSEAMEIDKFNKGKPPTLQKKTSPVLSSEQLKSLRRQLRWKRSLYSNQLRAINSQYPILEIPPDSFTQEQERGDDGFLSWAPEKEISQIYLDLMDAKEARKLEVKLENLSIKLQEYRTTDPELIKKKDFLLQFLNTENASDKFNLNTGTFTRLMNEFIARATQHGKMMIFKNVDNSAITTAPLTETPEKGPTLRNWGVLTDFVAENDSSMVRDMQAGKRVSHGKRAVVLISSYPLGGLPGGSTVIEMDVTPVDDKEAQIIVDSMIDSYVNDAVTAATLKMAYDIEKKYSGTAEQYPEGTTGTSNPSMNLSLKDVELSQISKAISKSKTSLAYISPEKRQMIAQLIIGMGQKSAIFKVRDVLAANAQYEKDEDGLRSNIRFDEEKILNEMITEITETKGKDVPGLSMRRSKVKFENYITKKGSTWGEVVGWIGAKAQSIQFFTKQINFARDQVNQLEFEIRATNISPQTRNEKIESLKGWQQSLQTNILMRDGAIKDISHFTILRGKPGVGKCLGRGTPVMMFDGDIKNAEDIVVGDLLMGPDSKPRTVLSTTSGIGPLYRVDQKKSESYICNNLHILSLQSTDKPSDQDPIFISAEDFCKKDKTWRYRHKGWKVGIEFSEKDLPIDPYWMGLWLGDGNSRVPTITIGYKDEEIYKWLEKWAKDNDLLIRREKGQGSDNWHFAAHKRDKNGYPVHHVKTKLKDLNLLQNKHIPEIYYKNSFENRLKLLAGLIDSDGYKTKTGSVQFTNVNKRLALDVLNLARSLGFKTTFTEGIKGIKKINYTVKAYTVTIGGTLSRIPSKLSRKQGHDNPQKRSLRHGIKVTPIGEGEYFGFSINGDQQFLLGDFTVTHNSIWGDALADLFGFMIANVDIGDAFDKWLGNSEKNANKLIEAIFNSRNIVYMIDEVDRMLDMGKADSGGGGAGNEGAHPVEKKVIAKFLEAFGERIPELKERNVFVIMTTNHVNAIDNALLKRAKGDVYDVQASGSPEDFLKFLETFLETERKQAPDLPWIRAGGITPKEMWDYTIKFVKENIDIKKLSEIFATRELSFRSLSGLVEKACRLHNSYVNEFLEPLSRGEPVTPTGMAMNTTNLVRAANKVDDDVTDARNVNLGVDDVYAEVMTVARESWKTIKLEEFTSTHSITKKPEKRYRLPQNFIDIMEGKVLPVSETPKEWGEVIEEDVTSPDDPSQTGKRKRVVLAPDKQPKDIKNLPDNGMKESPLVEPPVVDQEKINNEEKEKDPKNKKNTQGKSASTSEYLYNYLVAKGVINEKGIVVSKKTIDNTDKIDKNMEMPQKQMFDSLEQYGTYYFNNKQVCILSEPGTPPLSFYN